MLEEEITSHCYQKRRRILLSSNHPVVKLLIEDVHRRELHAGIEHTVLRQRFWLIKGRSTVRQTLRNCLICRHYQTKPFGQQMAPLPEDRIKPAPPFIKVGLDFAGPFYVKDSGKKKPISGYLHVQLPVRYTYSWYVI